MYDVIVIGAGQAGLAMGYYLKKRNVSFLILDKASEIGESWRKRYDSLTLFTPRAYSALPGLPLSGDQGQYPNKNEIRDYLLHYAKTFSLPIEGNTYIEKLDQIEAGFILSTNRGDYRSKAVVVATGPFQVPTIPRFSKDLSRGILQLHSAEYKNPNQLIEGPTLVVGGGNSGAQIASEIGDNRQVYLSVSHSLRFLPQDVWNKSIFWWFDKLGLLKANVNSKLGDIVKNMPDPIFGFELKEKIKLGKVTLKTKATSADGSWVRFQDGSRIEVKNIIWCTGYQTDYSWINLPSIFDEKGLPIQERGITSQKGLYFLGMPWQYRRGSALLQGVGTDAKYIANQL
jgi:putative flavoprotein involved in K+ transport